MLEGEAATEQEGDQVRPPEVPDFSASFGQLAPAVDPVGGHVRAQVGVRRRQARDGIAGSGDLEQGAGLGVAGAEGRELGCPIGGEDDQVGLLVVRAVARGGALPFAAAGGRTQAGRILGRG